jgi:hypothetical protein
MLLEGEEIGFDEMGESSNINGDKLRRFSRIGVENRIREKHIDIFYCHGYIHITDYYDICLSMCISVKIYAYGSSCADFEARSFGREEALRGEAALAGPGGKT